LLILSSQKINSSFGRNAGCLPPAKERSFVKPLNEIQDFSLRVNGIEKTLSIEPRVSLLDALRDHLGLHGTKKGCDQGACGACTVLVDGERINSCLALAIQYEGRDIVTI
jgi:xanthine dehydrogenase YagT iron-sulfur-binding subunit